MKLHVGGHLSISFDIVENAVKYEVKLVLPDGRITRHFTEEPQFTCDPDVVPMSVEVSAVSAENVPSSKPTSTTVKSLESNKGKEKLKASPQDSSRRDPPSLPWAPSPSPPAASSTYGALRIDDDGFDSGSETTSSESEHSEDFDDLDYDSESDDEEHYARHTVTKCGSRRVCPFIASVFDVALSARE